MPRRMAACRISREKRGKFSLIWMPGTDVSIGRNGPLLSVPGLGSKVSLWLGPPSIHRTMHRLWRVCCGAGACAARAARTFSQPDMPAPRTPAAESFSKSRRERSRGWFDIVPTPLVVQGELARIQDRPEDVGVGGARRP